jgi:CheY-like chemotaxis protein
MAKILLVDDDDAVRLTILLQLQNKGHVVLSASDGVMAMKLLAAQPVDLVIMDLQMPQQEGIETIRQIRMCSATLPLLAISGSGGDNGTDALRVAVKQGATEALAKPFLAKALHDCVDRLVKSSRPLATHA